MQISQSLTSLWKEHLNRLVVELAVLKKACATEYPYVAGYRDSQHPKDARIAIRGEKDNPGDVAPRRFLQVLSKPEPAPFSVGSGRLELAEAIANADNPLTARVMVNRIWHYHFGSGIVPTVSNFGQLGERLTHSPLLDYLAARVVETRPSVNAFTREHIHS